MSEARQHFDEALGLYEAGRRDAALQAFDKALQADPTFQNAWHCKGTSLAEMGRFAEAVQAFAKAVELDPADVHSWYNGGLARLQGGDFRAAAADFDKAVSLGQYQAEASYYKAAALHQLLGSGQGTPDDAEACIAAYSAALEADGSNHAARLQLTDLLTALGRFDEAIAAITPLTEALPNASQAWYARSRALLGKHGRGSEAFNDLSRAVQLNADLYEQAKSDPMLAELADDPRFGLLDAAKGAAGQLDAEQTCDKARRHIERGEHQHALDLLAKAVRAFPEVPEIWALSGSALVLAGLHSTAVEPLRHAIELDPTDAGSHLMLAVSVDVMGGTAEALGLVDIALGLPGLDNPGRAWHLKAHLLRKQNEDPKAHFDAVLEAYDKALGFSPDDIGLRLERGMLFLESERYDDADSVFDGLIGHKAGGLPHLMKSIGQLRRGLDPFPELEAALRVDPALKDQLAEDPSFAALKDDPRFAELIG